VRSAVDARRLDASRLVLLSKSLPCRVALGQDGFELHVPSRYAMQALSELDAYDAEEAESERAARADAALDREPPATRHAALAGVLVALALLAIFAVTGPASGGSRWFASGASDASRVMGGEWWRAVTALTLHADGAHVASNVALGAVVVGAVMHLAGIGWGGALVLASGIAGNVLNAGYYRSHHTSIGFSTAVFGAIGVLGGLTYMRERRRARPQRPAWTALGGVFALLAALGASESTDVLAHLFGGVAGLAVGMLASRWRPRTWTGQTAAGVAVVLTVAGAWVVAAV